MVTTTTAGRAGAETAPPIPARDEAQTRHGAAAGDASSAVFQAVLRVLWTMRHAEPAGETDAPRTDGERAGTRADRREAGREMGSEVGSRADTAQTGSTDAPPEARSAEPQTASQEADPEHGADPAPSLKSPPAPQGTISEGTAEGAGLAMDLIGERLAPVLHPVAGSDGVVTTSWSGALASGGPKTAGGAAASAEAPSARGASVAQQVEGALRWALQMRRNTVSIRLEPAEWGTLRIHLRAVDSRVDISFHASGSGVAEILAQSRSSMEASLLKDGWTLGGWDAASDGTSGGSHGEGSSRERPDAPAAIRMSGWVSAGRTEPVEIASRTGRINLLA